jgi:hypothetical protein
VSVARPYRTRTARPVDLEPHRSNAAIPVALVVIVLGLYLAPVSVVLTILFGLVLFVSAGSLLSTRLNPLSPTFYLTKKPSFLAIGVVFLGALILLGYAYVLWLHGAAVILPRF